MQIRIEEFFVIALFVFIIGTVIGSFLNVVILRALSGESIVLPPSKCPKCGNKLKWWHNIPILSYIFLGGKCGFCKEHISWQYPIIELITGIVFLLVFFKFGLSLETLFGFIVSSLLIVISVTDIKEKVVFDVHTYSLIGIGIIYSLYRTIAQIIHANQSSVFFTFSWDWLLHSPLVIGLAGGIAGALIMEIAARLGYILAGKRAFGEGDSYIAAGLGTVFGLFNIIFILILSVIVQMIFTLPVFIKKLIKSKDWATLISVSLFAIFAGAVYYLQNSLTYNETLEFFMIILLALTGLTSCWLILKGLRNNTENVTYMPFGPALAIAGLILLLFF